MTFRFLLSSLLATASLAGFARADAIQGVAYSVPASTADNVPTQGNVPGPNATEIATFSASALYFTGDGPGQYSLGGFLNSFNDAAGITYMNGGSASTSLDNILFEFTGAATFTNNEGFNVFHDDGVNLYVAGVNVLSAPSATSPISTPYTYSGPTGVFDFDFIYANGPCCNADFQTNLVTSTTVVNGTPEPSSLLLLATGIMCLCAVGSKFRRANQRNC